MSIRLMSQVWDESPFEGTALLIELALADFANDNGVCWPSIDTLATKARCSETWAHEVIRRLKKSGRLVVQEGGGRNRPNVYRLNLSEKGALNAPNASIQRVHSVDKRVNSVAKRVHSVAPDPSVEPSIEPPVDEPLARRNVFVLYDQYMGKPSITAMMRPVLLQAEEDYPDECLTHCFENAAKSSDGRRSWSYVESILKRHQAEGCHERKPMGRNAVAAPQTGDAAAIYASFGIRTEDLPVRVPAGGRTDGRVATLDGHDDP